MSYDMHSASLLIVYRNLYQFIEGGSSGTTHLPQRILAERGCWVAVECARGRMRVQACCSVLRLVRLVAQGYMGMWDWAESGGCEMSVTGRAVSEEMGSWEWCWVACDSGFGAWLMV